MFPLTPALAGVIAVATSPVPPPPAPTGLTTMSSGYSAVTLDWNDQGAVTFSVFRNGLLVTDGLTDSTYIDNTPTAGTTYSYTLTATDNATGLESAPCSPVDGTSGAGSAPSNTAAPVISDADGYFVVDSVGTWTSDPGNPSFTYQWQFNNGVEWNDIPSQTTSSYTPGEGSGAYRCRVRATNVVGYTDAFSNSITV